MLHQVMEERFIKDVLDQLWEESNDCMARDMAPKLLNVFSILKKFREGKTFQAKHNEWIKALTPIWRGSPTCRIKP